MKKLEVSIFSKLEVLITPMEFIVLLLTDQGLKIQNFLNFKLKLEFVDRQFEANLAKCLLLFEKKGWNWKRRVDINMAPSISIKDDLKESVSSLP